LRAEGAVGDGGDGVGAGGVTLVQGLAWHRWQ
jgi:hypothetical protein